MLAQEFLEAGFRGVVVCVDPSKLDGDFCGRELNAEFLCLRMWTPAVSGGSSTHSSMTGRCFPGP